MIPAAATTARKLPGMSSWDDVEVDSDGELLDWLWDIPDRYDVGIDESRDAAGADIPDDLPVPGAAGTALSWPPPSAASADSPTVAMAPVSVFADGRFDSRPVAMVATSRRRFAARDLATVAGLILIVAAGLGIGYSVFAGKGAKSGGTPASVAVGGATTTVPAFGSTPTTVTGDTSTALPPTTPAPVASSVPLAVAATSSTTATTVRRTTTTRPPTTLPPPTTTTTVPPTTTTTVPPTTTTSIATTSTTLHGR
jgi:hypothetical protein